MRYFVRYYDKDIAMVEGDGMMSDIFSAEYVAELLTKEKEIVTILEMILLPNED